MYPSYLNIEMLDHHMSIDWICERGLNMQKPLLFSYCNS